MGAIGLRVALVAANFCKNHQNNINSRRTVYIVPMLCVEMR